MSLLFNMLSSLDILFFSSISSYWSPRKAFLSHLVILWNSAFRLIYLSFYALPLFFSLFFRSFFFSLLLFFSQLFVRPPQTTILPFCISFPRGWFWSLLPTQCYEPPSRGSNLFSSVTQSCPTLCDPMNHSTPGLPVHYQLPESTQTHVHWVGDAMKSSHPLSSPSPALNLYFHCITVRDLI